MKLYIMYMCEVYEDLYIKCGAYTMREAFYESYMERSACNIWSFTFRMSRALRSVCRELYIQYIEYYTCSIRAIYIHYLKRSV